VNVNKIMNVFCAPLPGIVFPNFQRMEQNMMSLFDLRNVFDQIFKIMNISKSCDRVK